jgi:hypothetical protein
LQVPLDAIVVVVVVGDVVVPDRSSHSEHPLQSPQLHFNTHSFVFLEHKPLQVPLDAIVVVVVVGDVVVPERSSHSEHPLQSPQLHFNVHSFVFLEHKLLQVAIDAVGSGVSASSSSVCFVVGAGVANGFAVGDGVGL